MSLLSLTSFIVPQKPLHILASLFVIGLAIHRIVRYLAFRRRNPAGLPYPPGPNGYPIIGNFYDMPTTEQWRVYNDWSKKYGDVFSLEVLGQRIVVLNSLEAAHELLEKRSANYSDRPEMRMVLGLMRFDYNFGLISYGTWWKRHRRMFTEHFHENKLWKYQPFQAREARAFLNRLLHTPEKFIPHMREALGSSIMSIVYGVKITGPDDSLITNVEESMKGLNIAAVPGAFLVDLIPALKYVPSWFPGGGFKKTAAYWREVNRKVLELPFNHVRQQMKEGTAGQSLAAELITALPEGDEKLLAEETQLAQNVTAVTYIAAADSTVSAIQNFFLAMAKYPEVQHKAQTELDAVIGAERLPEFSDRPSLPYINALVKEIMRWAPVVPLAMPHVATEDDFYNGYFIPKGTMVFGNAWAILHDPKAFKKPEEFDPEHYLKDGQLDPTARQPDVSAFGFGRRICPGRFMSDNTLFSIVSSTLHTFNITPAVDENGIRLPLPTKTTEGIIVYPQAFKVDIKPRSASAEALIKDSVLGD